MFEGRSIKSVYKIGNSDIKMEHPFLQQLINRKKMRIWIRLRSRGFFSVHYSHEIFLKKFGEGGAGLTDEK
jgi:hypothetical protein